MCCIFTLLQVSVKVPPRDLHQDDIVVSGPRENVRDAIAFMMKRVEAFEEEAKDKV